MSDMYNPMHPGEFIDVSYIKPLNLKIRPLAERMDVAASTLSRLINGKSDVTPEMALKLSAALGRSAESWLIMQDNFSLWQARKSVDTSGIVKVDFENGIQTVGIISEDELANHRTRTVGGKKSVSKEKSYA